MPDDGLGSPPQTSNFRKYQNRSPIIQGVFAHFFDRLGETVARLKPVTVLDAGCGEGETIARLRALLPADVTAFDRNPACVEYARRRHPGVKFSVEDIYSLPWPDANFDLVLCTEVLEHLAEPARALAELARVARRDIVVSVPHEPWFDITNRIGNVFQPGVFDPKEHVQHYNPVTLRRLLEPFGSRVDVRLAASWILAHVTVDQS